MSGELRMEYGWKQQSFSAMLDPSLILILVLVAELN
jgi:hypothetical protein